jgi:hypothetical protein
MKNHQTPTFSSPELQAAVAKAQPILEGIDEARNRISNDIRELENWLQSLDLKRSFRFSLVPHVVTDKSPASPIGLVDEQEALLWDEGDKSKRLRLLYEMTRCGSYEVDAACNRGPIEIDEQREVKPLIETKFEIRQRMYPLLPDFVASLAKSLGVHV